MHIRVDNEMRYCFIEILNEKLLPTLVQINQELRQRLPETHRSIDRSRKDSRGSAVALQTGQANSC